MHTNVRKMATAAVFAAISIVLMLFEIPIPFLPPWLEIDLSSVPILIASFSLGPLWGLGAQIVKSIVHIPMGGTGGVGELADILMGAAFILPASILYRRNRTRRTAMIGMGIGVVLMCVVGSLCNYYVLVPLLFKGNMDAAISGAVGENSPIHNLGTYILYAVIPFNLLKGIVVSFVTMLIYKRVQPLINRFSGDAHAVSDKK